ncbi:MAG TPA: ATP-binding cassette domain-containing protein [Candidatus Saccharimonadales bacterium]|nr:ATP-binding cassette domain-containing protein [Candidatus Saccharimonadales bacterium]
MENNSPAIISVKNIKKNFGKNEALKGITFDAEPGKVLGLLGPNGAGKTTLIKILTTLLDPTSGSATVAGLDVRKNAPELRKVIGLAGQYAAVDENLTGRENLEMVARLYHMGNKLANERATQVLKEMTLEEAGNRPVKTYSGGMRRRLDVGASLLFEPKVLFLDEPTTGLDPRTRSDLWELIRSFVAKGTSVVLTTQYLEEADALADNIVLIDKGKIIAQGTSRELKRELGGNMVEVEPKEWKDHQKIAELLKPKYHDGVHVKDSHQLITVPAPNGPADLREVLDTIEGAGIELIHISLTQPTLDEVFLTYTGEEPSGE